MRAELIPISGGRPIPITRDITVVGRREYCDLQIDDPSLSKRHCVLIKTDGLLIVRDLITTNGTKVKGQLVRWAALLPDDSLTLGKVRFRVYLGPTATTAAPPEPTPGRQHASRSAAPAAPAAPSAPAPAAPARHAEALVPAKKAEDLDWLDGLSSIELDDDVIDLD